MIRDDGRSVEELRPITLVYERLDRVDGSARFGFGMLLLNACICASLSLL